MINVDCDYNIAEDIKFLAESELIINTELSQGTKVSQLKRIIILDESIFDKNKRIKNIIQEKASIGSLFRDRFFQKYDALS